MATLDLYNTLSGTIQPLTPVGAPELRMYCCGPTVYDYGHIGNFRTFLHVDVLRRFLRQQGVAIRHVMNITDVDDKIIRNAAAAGMGIAEYSKPYETAFFEDLEALGIERPELIARATECIPEMVTLVEQLAAKEFAYQAEDGSWYFRVAQDEDYGKLAKKDLDHIEDGARIEIGEFDKDAVRDFALWKAVKALPDGSKETSWQTPLGDGRPGWHLECSAMATKFLGNDFDLHAGGEDLMFPHHENEIAQSESASGRPFARHWMHVRFLLVEGKKMSKSEGNFYTLRDLLLRGHRVSAIRFLLISVPYRHQLNFTFEDLAASANAIDRLRTFYQRMLKGADPGGVTPFAEGIEPKLEQVTTDAAEMYTAALANDLNTAEARAAIFDLVRAANTAADQGTLLRGNAVQILAVLDLFEGVFAVLKDRDAELTRAALSWAEKEHRLNEADPALLETLAFSDAEIDGLVQERTLAKKQRNFARADAIRNDLLNKGILLEDAKDGVRWKRK